MYRTTTLLLLAVFALSCANPMRILDEGNYMRAYDVSKRQIDRRLQRDKSAKNEQRIALHGSYRQWQDALNAEVAELTAENTPERWLRLHTLYSEMLHLRRDIEAYRDVVPDLLFHYDIESLAQLTERARVEAADYCYGEAEALFADARQGAKPAARQAHHWLNRSLEYAPERQSYRPLVAEMYDLGTLRIQVSPLASGHFGDDNKMADYFNHRQAGHWRRDWLEVFHAPTDRRIDYYVELENLGANVSGNQENRDTDCYEKEVQDGCKTVEEKVTKGDTTIIVKKQVPIMITVRGCITTVRQYKEAEGAMRVHLYAADDRYASQSWQLYGNDNWANEFEICEGDSRALPSSCFGMCFSFPSDGSMLCDVADELRWDLRNSLIRTFSDTQLPRKRSGLFGRISGE
jgi:hypothetical protein